jgi:ArsR family transcriptional regulator
MSMATKIKQTDEVLLLKKNFHPREDIEKVCQIFHLLSDCTRFKIVQVLSQGSFCVGHLLEVCEGSPSAISHQLRVLRDNGIIKAKRFGKNVEYSIVDEHIQKIVEMGIEHLNCSKD